MIRALLVAVIAFVTFAALPAPAYAMPFGLEYSVDGAIWNATPPGALFPVGYRLSPGDSVESTLFVRSAHPTPVHFSAVIRGVSWSDNTAASSFFVSGADQDGPGLAATAAGSIVDCTPLVSSRDLAPGAVVTLATIVSIPATVTGVTAQGKSVNFTLQLGLSDPAATTTPGGCPILDEEANIPSVPSGQGETGGKLGYTGVAFVPETLAATAAVTALGFLLLLVARRKRADRDLTPDRG